MEVPFSYEQFIQVFKNYNTAVFPMQIIFCVMAAVAVYFSLKRNHLAGKIISGILSFFWLWMGVVYHLIFFIAINKAAYFFGGLFILESIFFLVYGVLKDKLVFRLQQPGYGMIAIILIAYALLIYPLIGFALGRVYPYNPTFGLPCPTVIFTFGMLLIMEKKFPWIIIVIPLLWSLIGFFAAIFLAVKEDIGLLIAGVSTALLLVVKSRTSVAVSTKMNQDFK
jgi:hypothetical protein